MWPTTPSPTASSLKSLGPCRGGGWGALDPLAGLNVTKVIGVGGSQSAGRLATYINAVQPVEHVFDGFVLFTWFGSGSSIDDPAPININTTDRSKIITHQTKIRDDLGVPVMVVNTE